MARKFVRPAPGNRYTPEQRKAWGAEQDRLRAGRAAGAAQAPQVAAPLTKPPAKRASRAKGLIADVGGSTCFNSLVYTGGEVIAQFQKGGGVYSYPMSRADAKEWFNDASLGEFFNAFVR
jgi:hypothetical protein